MQNRIQIMVKVIKIHHKKIFKSVITISLSFGTDPLTTTMAEDCLYGFEEGGNDGQWVDDPCEEKVDR